MNYKNEKHRELFGEAVRRKDKKDYELKVVRQLIDCIKVMSADMIKICFKDGTVTEVLI